MSDALAALVGEYSKPVIVVSLVVILLLGAGATGVEQSSSLSQFETDGPEAAALDYVETNLTAGDGNTTTVQVIVRDDDGNVLSRESLLRSLEFQQALRADEQVNATLVEDRPVVGVSNVVAVAANRTERAASLRAEAERLRERNQTFQQRREDLAADRAALQERRATLNGTSDRLALALNQTARLQRQYEVLNLSREDPRAAQRIAEDLPEGVVPPGEVDRGTYRREAQAIRDNLAGVRQRAVANLTGEETAAFDRSLARVRDLQAQLFQLRVARVNGEIDEATFRERQAALRSELRNATRAGTRGVLAERIAAIESDAQDLEERGADLEAAFEDLEASFAALQERRQALRTAPAPSLDRQIEQLRSMNDSEVESVVATVVSREGGRERVFRLLPTGYDAGSTTAIARTMVVTQRTEDASTVQGPGGPSDRITDAQTRIEAIAAERVEAGEEYVVFGFGLISDEIARSQSDSFLLVGPLAVLFVLVTLLVAYRDLLDIVLGLAGIGSVLAITFGAMGWLGIDFNQVLIAVPVLLIGLSIDYAIHIFMRHREQRGPEDQPRGSMRTALAGVGVALLWVTATTVIGFASNLISPLGPIQDFGVVSSIGIAGALLVFGAFVPALKVELDTLLEGAGLDRRKRAFGTGGGTLSSVLSVGATAARRAPTAVIVVALLVTAIAGAGGSQVSTSFEQSDFLASEPPTWTKELPEPFRPGEYSTKQNLEYVNENFRREDARSQVLLRGSVATPGGVAQIDAVGRRAADSPVAFELATGEAAVEGPLGEMRAVAAENESFNATFSAADTDGDGVPDRNVRQVLDAFFSTAPDRASRVVHRVQRDGTTQYVAARVVVSVKGTAGTDAVTEETREWAAAGETGDLEATATGSQVVNQIVQDDLLSTVIESLVVSIVAVFLFLMVAYRVTEGSASLGAVTLLPVVLSVAWILGTMFAIGQPFNVLTGTITSLTVGLGVAYSIHLSERYTLELDRQGDVHGAMHTAVTGTGGALLGSAATTVGGFGTLIVAIFPALQQFGLITGITIVYAFLASVLVLPSLLVVWTTYLGPDVDDIDPDDAGGPDRKPTTGATPGGSAGAGTATGGITSPSAASGTGAGSGSTAAAGQQASPGAESAGDAPGAGGGAASTADDTATGPSTGGTGLASDEDEPNFEPSWTESDASPTAGDAAVDEDDGDTTARPPEGDTGESGDGTGDSADTVEQAHTGRDTTSEADDSTEPVGESEPADDGGGADDGEHADEESTGDDGGGLFGGAAEPVPPAEEEDEEDA